MLESKHSKKLAQVEALIKESGGQLTAKEVCEKVGLSPHTWYTRQSKNKTRKRRSRTLGVQEVTLPEAKLPSPAKVFAFVGSTDQISEILRGIV